MDEDYFGYPLLTKETAKEIGILKKRLVNVEGLPERPFSYCVTGGICLDGPYKDNLVIDVFDGDIKIIVVPEDKVSLDGIKWPLPLRYRD